MLNKGCTGIQRLSWTCLHNSSDACTSTILCACADAALIMTGSGVFRNSSMQLFCALVDEMQVCSPYDLLTDHIYDIYQT